VANIEKGMLSVLKACLRAAAYAAAAAAAAAG